MLRLLALAAHFSPLNPGPYDPAVVELLNTYFEPEKNLENVVDFEGNPQKSAQDPSRSENSKAA